MASEKEPVGDGSFLSLDLVELLDPQYEPDKMLDYLSLTMVRHSTKYDLLDALRNRVSSSPYLVSELDQEIAAKNRRLVGVRTVRNAMLPIFTLPTELLSRIIFESVIDSPWPREIYWMYWLRLMNVCRRFLDVVLSTHALWSYIAVPCNDSGTHFSFKRVQLQVKRAGTLPLSIKLRLYSGSVNVDFAYLSTRCNCSLLSPERISNLDMEGTALILKSRLPDFANKVYPVLERLHIKAVDLEDVQESLPLMLPPSVLSGDTSRIRYLELENVVADLSHVNGLFELALLFDMNNPATHGPSYTFSAIVSMLTRSPNLTSLDIFLPWFSSSDFKNFGRTPLSN